MPGISTTTKRSLRTAKTTTTTPTSTLLSISIFWEDGLVEINPKKFPKL
jgi:hypothetical protein